MTTNLFRLGEFALSSGRPSRLKIDCDALGDDDIEALALLVRHLVGPFSSVEGVPRGGVRLAEALRMYEIDGPHLIVDDVLTTGAGMVRAAKACGKPAFVGAVIFARGPCPAWVEPVFRLHPELEGR